MSAKKKPFFEKVEKPIIERTQQSSLYTSIVEGIEKQEAGWYKVEVPNRKPATVYLALSKRVKDRKNLKSHFIKGITYIEKT